MPNETARLAVESWWVRPRRDPIRWRKQCGDASSWPAPPVLVAARAEEPGASAAPWSSGSETPRLEAPPGATDCHHYVYDHRYPAFSDTIKRPDDATPQDYRALMRRLGIRRQVLVQPSAYGGDNRSLLDSLAAFGGDTRAVAVVDTAVADAVLKRFDRLGVRGLYFNFAPSNEATTATMIEPLARRIAPLGWHVEINVWAADLPPLLPVLRRLPTPVVLDRFGHAPSRRAPITRYSRRYAGSSTAAIPGLNSSLLTTPAKWAHPTIPIRVLWRAPISTPRRRDWCGAPTGRILARKRSRTMRPCSICSPIGRPKLRRATEFWSKPRAPVRISAKRLNVQNQQPLA
jgi:hypothetical protein